MSKLDVVVGGFFGSEAKGHVTGHLSRKLDNDGLVIRVGGSNAGHSIYNDRGNLFKFRQVPVAAVTSQCRLAIAAGSEIDLAVLAQEVAQLEAAGYPVGDRLTVDPFATIIQPEHVAQEASMGLIGRIGSTGKGVGAARANRIWRIASILGDKEDEYQQTMKDVGVKSIPPIISANWQTASGVIVEGTQGYGLGLHTRFYPKVTSSDCRAIDFLGMAGISPWASRVSQLRVWVTLRVYPIRVAGDSGPLLNETTWKELGLPEERTTVTDKIRRVGQWDAELAEEAVIANGGSPAVRIALMMLDQKFPQIAGVTDSRTITNDDEVMQFIQQVEDETGVDVELVGTGPHSMVDWS